MAGESGSGSPAGDDFSRDGRLGAVRPHLYDPHARMFVPDFLLRALIIAGADSQSLPFVFLGQDRHKPVVFHACAPPSRFSRMQGICRPSWEVSAVKQRSFTAGVTPLIWSMP